MPAPVSNPLQPTPYDDRFFDHLNVNSAQSAQVIAPLLLELIQPRSIIDIGCGEGAWLSEFAGRGIDDYLGVDGDYVDRKRLKIAPDRFKPVDLQRSFDPGRIFDLAICLEVAEHLSADAAAGFVASLTRCAPVICFSAAIPGQGGTDHQNEQWPSYWADLFAAHDYHCFDVLRPRLWQSTQVSYWYAQNALLFLHGSVLSRFPTITTTGSRQPDALVHPSLWMKVKKQHAADQYHIAHPGLKRSTESMFRAATEWIGKWFSSESPAIAAK